MARPEAVVQRRIELLEGFLPRIEETGWLLLRDRDGIYHGEDCPRSRGPVRLAEQKLGALRRGEGCCRSCTGKVFTEAGSVGGMLLRLSEPLARFIHSGAACREDALTVLLRGSNRVVPAHHFQELKRRHLLSVLQPIGRRGGDLCALTIGDFHDPGGAPEVLLGPLLRTIAEGFVVQSPRGGVILYTVPRGFFPGGATHPRVLEVGWEHGDHAEATETFGMFADDALSGSSEWRPVQEWWSSAKLL